MKSLQEFLRNFFKNKGQYVFFSLLIAKICGFISSIAVVRMLPQSDFGIMTIAASVFAVFATFSGLGSSQGFLRFGAIAEQAEEKEKQIQAERQKAEAERKAIEEKARKEREESDRKLRAEQKAARVAAEKAAAERAKLEAEIKAKNEAEAKARKDADAKVLADQKAKVDAELQAKRDAEAFAKAPIKTQLTLWVDLFVAPQTSIANEKTALILEKFQAFKKWAKNEVDSM